MYFRFEEEMFKVVLDKQMNDANLNPGFSLDTFRENQLDLHNYYRSLHGGPPMTENAVYVSYTSPF